MDPKITKKKSPKTKAVTVGAGLAGLAAAAYFFLGPEGKKNQKYAKAWAIKMKGDVIEKLESAKKITEPAYHQIIDSVAKKHEKIVKTDSREVKALAQDLKKHWQVISGSLSVPVTKKPLPVKKAAPITKKVVKKPKR